MHDDEHDSPPESEGQVSAEDMEAHLDALVEQTMRRAIQLGDPALMPPDQADAYLSGYQAGRASGFDDGYAAGYAACDAEIARLQRAAVAATRTGEAWPSLNPANYEENP